ncbi:MAG: filamentous hemagglutinin N-terminal domain-containing protein [Nitrosomonadales bacterium]|nr:filamentous hemagglutinin N-terminal domain-containing protein [Nitrosomonadales bacterium]
MPRIASHHPQFRIRPLCAALLFAFTAQNAQANPAGGAVISGQASFAASGNTLTVTNTPGAIIHWQGFSIDANEITRFAQQSASSTVLNRVVTANPSNILGSLQSNGRVFLINPNGIVFGQGATVDVAGLVASTLNLSDADFQAGRYNFIQAPGAANIKNAGNITAQDGGQIYLIAPNVENSGVITAPNGEILLAAGHSVELVDTANPNLRVNITAPSGDATNVGQLVASAGSLGLFGTVVRNSGTVSASSAVMEGGKIVFKASQDTYLDKDARVLATGTKGGSIEVSGNRVAVMDNVQLDVSGQNGGGSALIGGDYQGKNPEIQNASITYFGPNAGIKANAIENGDGGKVIVWADDITRAYGNISAKGGAMSGDGGFVEISGKNHLDFQGRVNTLAPQGSAGTLLLDPTDITIDATGPDNLGGGAFSTGIFSGTTGNAILTWSTINLQTGSLEIRTTSPGGTGGSGDINISASGSVTGPTTLTLLANRDINIGPGVSVASGNDINLIAGWNNTGWAVTSGVGNINFGTGSSLSTSGNLYFNAGNSVSQNPSGTSVSANLLTIGNTNGNSLPGGVSMLGNNMVGTLAVQIDSAGTLNFSNGQSLVIGPGAYSINGIAASGNTSPINISTTAGNLTVSQPIVSDVLGGSPITLAAANTLTLNAAVTSTFNATPAGPVRLQAGTGGIASNTSGIITAAGLKVTSGGNVVLIAANMIDTLAGTSAGLFEFSDAGGFTVGIVDGTTGLTASSGDISLRTGGSVNSPLTISNNVQATTGSVTYITDNLAHNAFTTTSGSTGAFVEVKPFTTSTAIEFSATADAAGILRLSSGELNFSTPLLRVGNSSMAGNIAVAQPVAPTAFSSLSLITGGSISQAAGSTLTIANLNADGWSGVTLNEANSVTNLGGHTSTGNFSFTDANAINIGQVDINNGITVTTSGNITVGTTTSDITLNATALNTAAGTITLNAANNVHFTGGTTAITTPGTAFNLNAGGGIFTDSGATVTLQSTAGTLAAQVLNGRIWQNGGTINLQANSAIDLLGSANPGTLSNLAGGTININTGGWAINSNPGSQNGVFINAGTVNVNTGGSFEAAFSNTGTLNINGANTTLSLQNGQAIAGAVNINNPSATLWVSEYHGTPATFSGTTIGGSGVLLVQGGISPIANFSNTTITGISLTAGTQGTINFNTATSLPTLNLTGGTLGGTGALTLTGASTWSGNTTLGARAITVNGTLNLGTLALGSGASLLASGGTLNATSISVGAGGLLGGSGSINANVFNDGTVAPGNSPGALTISGNYTQGPGATLAVELGGTAAGTFDTLDVTGMASLDGTLSVSMFGGFIGSAGDVFPIINAYSISGAFATVSTPAGYNFNSNYLQPSYLQMTLELELPQGSAALAPQPVLDFIVSNSVPPVVDLAPPEEERKPDNTILAGASVQQEPEAAEPMPVCK